MSASDFPEYNYENVDISALAIAQLNSVSDLLKVLEMSKWKPKFDTHGIDLPTLFFVQDEHLIQLGLSLPERIKLLRCVQLLKDVPPPPASMGNSWKKPSTPVAIPVRMAPPRQVKKLEIEEKEEELAPESEAAAVQEEEEEAVEQVAGEEDDDSPAVAVATAATTGALLSTAGTAGHNETTAHSMVFLRSEATGVSEKYCTVLQAAFEDELKAKSVAYVPSDEADQVLTCLEVFLQNSTPDDDLLWVVFCGTGTEDELMPGLTFQVLAAKVEANYKGRRVFVVIDTCCPPEFAEDEGNVKANENLQISLLFSVYPTAPNPCYLALCLLDTIRGRIFARSLPHEEYTLKTFANDALETIEFIGRCSETEILGNYVNTPQFNDEDLAVIQSERVPVPKTTNGECGLRGIYEDRPVQIIEMNGPQRVQVRFLDEDSDPEWANLQEVLLDEEGADEGENLEEGGRGRPLPVPPPVVEESSSAVDVVVEEEALVEMVPMEDIAPAIEEEEMVHVEPIDEIETAPIAMIEPVEEMNVEEPQIEMLHEEMEIDDMVIEEETEVLDVSDEHGGLVQEHHDTH